MPSEPLKAGVDFSPGQRSGERSVNLWVDKGDGETLTQVAEWVDAGVLQVFVDSNYPLEQYAQAFGRIRQHAKRGRVVLTLDPQGDPA